MMIKDISANLKQKRLILCNDILLKVLRNVSLKVLLPRQHTGFQTFSIKKGIYGHSQRFIFIFANGCLICMIEQAYKYVSSSLWFCLAFFKLKITNILKSSGWGLEQSELPWEQNFYSHRCVSHRTISLPSFNGLHYKLAKIALFIPTYPIKQNQTKSQVRLGSAIEQNRTPILL